MSDSPASSLHQTLIGIGAIVLAVAMAWGASSISSTAGYSGVGPNFLPWVVAIVLAVCGAWLVWEARSGGFREVEPPSGAERADWTAFAWLSAGVLANAALITTIGFVLSCTLLFALAVRGLRYSEGKPSGGARQTLLDVVTGMLISAPVFWLFTKLLAINLPGLTGTGWL
ncbi:tripartite tricarboxylate transporter TctB family protein [Piscinibacter sp. XHJ-5]|uniref:tripartite tricarboxylate transporter TctB family protein n=1 Tax=Piscinibacter sp. XHJ-5 TaxID=3037797 RepID=UPI00245322C4|nr:tripartite tricarboxylate transporter TctB family protein [Piscinibacter sp. XHJ-5]